MDFWGSGAMGKLTEIQVGGIDEDTQDDTHDNSTDSERVGLREETWLHVQRHIEVDMLGLIALFFLGIFHRRRALGEGMSGTSTREVYRALLLYGRLQGGLLMIDVRLVRHGGLGCLTQKTSSLRRMEK
jgi:hypothetical protein